MHGILELFALISFTATVVLAFSAYRLGRPRAWPVLILVALWPLLLLVFSERGEAVRWLSWRFLALQGLMIIAAALGAFASALLLRWAKKR